MKKSTKIGEKNQWLNKKPQKGVGTDITVNLKYVCPAKVVSGVPPHKDSMRKLEKGSGEKGGERGFPTGIIIFLLIFFHEAFGKEVYSVERWVNVTKEGPETDIFVGDEGSYERMDAREGNDYIGG